MSETQLVCFDGRAVAMTLCPDQDMPDAGPRHLLALSSAMVQVAAAARESAEGMSDDGDSQVRGLLVALELMGSLCVVISDALASGEGDGARAS